MEIKSPIHFFVDDGIGLHVLEIRRSNREAGWVDGDLFEEYRLARVRTQNYTFAWSASAARIITVGLPMPTGHVYQEEEEEEEEEEFT